jgi:hypothetical protein
MHISLIIYSITRATHHAVVHGSFSLNQRIALMGINGVCDDETTTY